VRKLSDVALRFSDPHNENNVVWGTRAVEFAYGVTVKMTEFDLG
jgi:hypothetical protein